MGIRQQQSSNAADAQTLSGSHRIEGVGSKGLEVDHIQRLTTAMQIELLPKTAINDASPPVEDVKDSLHRFGDISRVHFAVQRQAALEA